MTLDAGVAEMRASQSPTARLAALRGEIATVARACGRDPATIVLVGVTKRQTRAMVEEALAAALTDVAENYLQESREKLAGLAVRKHFIGHLQTNKAKAIVELFDVVQSVDRDDAAEAIAKASQRLERPVRTLVQVNISPTDRFGIAPEAAPALAARMRKMGLIVDGIMAVAPNTEENGAIAASFRTARATFERVGGPVLSIGMSADWREAIRHGSTMLRIGSAIFGART